LERLHTAERPSFPRGGTGGLSIKTPNLNFLIQSGRDFEPECRRAGSARLRAGRRRTDQGKRRPALSLLWSPANTLPPTAPMLELAASGNGGCNFPAAPPHRYGGRAGNYDRSTFVPGRFRVVGSRRSGARCGGRIESNCFPAAQVSAADLDNVKLFRLRRSLPPPISIWRAADALQALLLAYGSRNTRRQLENRSNPVQGRVFPVSEADVANGRGPGPSARQFASSQCRCANAPKYEHAIQRCWLAGRRPN